MAMNLQRALRAQTHLRLLGVQSVTSRRVEVPHDSPRLHNPENYKDQPEPTDDDQISKNGLIPS